MENFSLKIKYPECFYDPIKDQGLCQDSSSFSAAFALSKMFCIKKKSTYSKISLSPQDLISCQNSINKCFSSDLNESYDYMVTNGISEESCIPFESTVSLIEGKSYVPPCKNYCKKFEMSYIKYKARPYSIISNDGIVFADIIKEDIYSSGPVSTYMDLYDDFLTYRGGIYTRTEDSSLITTTHAVTLIGYGRDNNNVVFWIAANSFGSNWGEDGYFKIPLGHCNIGKLAISATPNIPDLH